MSFTGVPVWFRRGPGSLPRAVFIALVLLLGAGLATGPGCGGGKTTKKSGKKRGKGKKSRKGKKKKAAEKDPTGRQEVSQELKEMVKGLGAKEETFWQAAQEKLEGMGEAAIPGLNWGLKFPLQNIRARCCNILSRMKKSESMVPGAMRALKKWPDDTSHFEAPIRRWAAKVLSDLYSIYTEDAIRQGIDRDKDLGVDVLLAAGAIKLGIKNYVSILIKGMAAEEDQVAVWAAAAFGELIPHGGFDASAFSSLSRSEREAKSEELRQWWKENYSKTKPVRVDKDYEPWPVTVEIKVYKEPEEPLDPEDEREVDLYVRDAEDHLSRGDARRACACYAEAFRYSGRRRKDLALKQHELMRKIGPDFADKSYKYLREKLIPWDPLNEDFWIAAAKSALASGGGLGRQWARESLNMALILAPDNEEAKALLEETEER